MGQAFIVMQIGDAALDEVCRAAMIPAIQACGLEAKRVDKHNSGGILKSEIVRYLRESDIIVADLTNARPNVYLEVGYAMGLEKFKNLILTVRHDHFLDSPYFVKGGPRIHFDLLGYDILAWHPDQMEQFRIELEKRIRRRMSIGPNDTPTPQPTLDIDWFEAQRSIAGPGFLTSHRQGAMEVWAALGLSGSQWRQSELIQAAQSSQIHTFGWPIGLIGVSPEDRPKPRTDGVFASILKHESYDYWAIRNNGDVFITNSLFEDELRPNTIMWDTRTVRVTEALMYLQRLYVHLRVDPSTQIEVLVRHRGLRGRTLSVADPRRAMHTSRTSHEESCEVLVSDTLGGLEANLLRHVVSVIGPLLILFDFFELDNATYERVVTDFRAGRR